MPFVDIHTHNPEFEKDVVKVINLSLDTGFRLNEAGGNFFTAGIHPWEIETTDVPETLRKIEGLLKERAIMGLGETGLDMAKGPSDDMQEKVFLQHILLSEKYKVPLIIHCVKKYNEILKLRMETGAKQSWIMHGFNSSAEMMRRFTEKGIFISLGSGLLKNNKKTQAVCSETPGEFLFLETDVANLDISDVYLKAAEIRNITVEHLKRVVFSNFKRVFRLPQSP